MRTFAGLLIIVSAGALTAETGGFPWELLRTYRYTWLRDGRPIGESVLRFEKLEGRNPPAYKLVTFRRYDERGNSLRVDGELVFTAEGLPVKYRERARLRPFLKGARATQEIRVEFASGTARTVSINNGREDRAVRRTFDVPKDARLLPTQALEHWAVLALGLAGKPRVTLRVFYPEFGLVMEIVLRREKKDEKVPFAADGARGSRYRFECTNPRYSGRIWVDSHGRLLAYEQGDLRLVLDAGRAPSNPPDTPQPAPKTRGGETRP